MRRYVSIGVLLLVPLCRPLVAQGESREGDTSRPDSGRTTLLLRCDDWGMNHAVNSAALRVMESGTPVSASVMFACPWYQETVEQLKAHPHVSVGIHLTLNAEWKNYRWGPVAGAAQVPTLVDSLGFFYPSRALLFGRKPKLEEIERELRAQIERAIHSGLRIDYVDYHMGAAVQTPETRAIVERLAGEYHLAISRYFGERDVNGMYDAPPDQKGEKLMLLMERCRTDSINLIVFHIGEDTPEMSALEDLNSFGLQEMSKHRQAELDALLSPRFQELIRGPGYRLTTYGKLMKESGLDTMKRPGN